jgi:hypothetical protein
VTDPRIQQCAETLLAHLRDGMPPWQIRPANATAWWDWVAAEYGPFWTRGNQLAAVALLRAARLVKVAATVRAWDVATTTDPGVTIVARALEGART